jgi:cytochrome oxidase Cu insertion factor (SCO1/SenC/PrrC family)
MIRKLMIVCMTIGAMLADGVPASARIWDGPQPDITVVDQNGVAREFFGDLLRGRTVAIDFFYTSCTRFCRPLSANLTEVQQKLADRMGKDIALVSVSIDPVNDTPPRLKAYATQFGAAKGWTFVTGARPDIARLMERLGQTLGNPDDHMPLVLLHRDGTDSWTHFDGYDPDAIAGALVAAAGPPQQSNADSPPRVGTPAEQAAQAYLGNPLLVTQDGRQLRFFDDLLDGRLVLINFMLAGCHAICPPETANLARVQDLLGDRLGRSVVMMSLTVDPEHDGPEQLKRFADSFGARDGWYFLTGNPPEVQDLARRLGGYTTDPADHSALLIVANVEAGSWIKLPAMADPAQIVHRVLSLSEAPPR